VTEAYLRATMTRRSEILGAAYSRSFQTILCLLSSSCVTFTGRLVPACSCERRGKATLSGCPVDEATYTFTSCMDAALSTLVAHLLDGDSEAALAEARRVRASQPDGQRLLVEGLEAAMDGMSAKCTTEQFNLLEIMLTGRAAMAVAREAFRGRDSWHARPGGHRHTAGRCPRSGQEHH